MKYTTVIGLEIHAELKTKSKIFCSCENSFGDERNTRCCPVCTALPGSLPSLNREAVEMTIAAGLALGCEIAPIAKWDRKNYFYPDLPKAYQISELYAPICIGGGLSINGRAIRLNHIHLEEDAGKLVHQGVKTFLDYNRAGVPLIEIVTEPDMRSPEEAAAFVEKVRRTLVYIGVCDGRMEQGSLRCDANISIMPEGSEVLGTRTEIKNLNSFRFIKSAIEYEVKRQMEVLGDGEKVIQETRRYDAQCGETFSMRSKENAHDYRYFPDPDIPPVLISREDAARIGERLPELPEARLERYTKEFGLSEVDAETILAEQRISDYYDTAIKLGAEPRVAANSIKGELMRCLNTAQSKGEIPVAAEDFVKVINLAAQGKISQNGLKKAIAVMFEEGKDAETVIKEQNLMISEDLELVASVIEEVLKQNPAPLAQYKSGDTKVLGFFMGQCSKVLKGKAHPKTIQDLLKKALDNA
ncbi:MAG: Asp-tRNA(Asn)/Glu-tRNA(Gln) amidotransferase subunit GatB [Oscillospiraceae bacterium]|jgi:aspartyl-tRNA(Asn)/glutamyl-tRNA(Gln) amidotransferase subunit B|nr:Asp-tRNA(Asn)/Glu-tRNA(Gln) amidotransferase subunit GatB [Oscillospiraceae bacterium]